MTRHTVTVEKTVEADEEVYTCDYCGLGDDAGEMFEYAFAGTDAYGDGDTFRQFDEWDDPEDFELGSLHFHASCVPHVATNDDVAELTLAGQYHRRTGDVLLFVITGASLVIYGLSFALFILAHYSLVGLGKTAAFALGVVFLLVSLAASHREAQATLKEFST